MSYMSRLLGSIPATTRKQIGRGLVACLTVVLSMGVSSAFGAPPEAPEAIAPESVTGISATLRGVLNATTFPVAPGTYQFLYRAGSECEGGNVAPEAPGMYLGLEPEAVSQSISGLEPHTEYTVCLLATNVRGEATVGTAVHFITALIPEAPETDKAELVGATTAKLNGVLNPNDKGVAGSYEFLYQASASECVGGGATSTEPGGSERKAVSAEAVGLLPDTEYTFCLLARNEAGGSALGSPQTFTTLPESPIVTEESFSDVGSGSAHLNAEINPEGSPSEYYFEYATAAEYEANGSKYITKTSPVSFGAGQEPIGAPAELTGLTPKTEYHFRAVATNINGEQSQGEDKTFSTLSAGILDLPDGRVYERVTPINTESANVYISNSFGTYGLPLSEGTPTRRPFRAASDGDGVVYAGDPTAGGVGVGGTGAGNEYLATRSAEGGWTQANLQPPGFFKAEYESFSSDLSSGFLDSPSEDPLDEGSPLTRQAPGEYNVLYQRDTLNGSYQSLFTIRPPDLPASEFRPGIADPWRSVSAVVCRLVRRWQRGSL